MKAALVIGATLAWFGLPLVPALRELRRTFDRPDLLIDGRHTGQPTHFAGAMAERASAPGNCAGLIDEALRHPARDQPIRVLPDGGCIEGDAWVDGDVYSRGDMTLGAGARVRAACASGTLVLHEAAALRRWGHGRDVVAHPDCRLGERLTADRHILLSAPASFRRLHAPTLRFDACERAARRPVPLHAVDAAQLGRVVHGEPEPMRTVLAGPVCVPGGSRLSGSLVVWGDLRIGPHCSVAGSLKAHGDLVVEAGATVEGAIVAHRDVEVGPGAHVTGPVLGEREVRLAAGCVIGQIGRPTSVSADRIRVAAGARVHGTAWARIAGQLSA